jgi:hypothetical protein
VKRLKIWTRAAVEELDGRASAALTTIFDRFDNDAQPVGEGLAWGQYLDDERSSGSHWGIYGTSAGIQVLSLRCHVEGRAPSGEAGVAKALVNLPTCVADFETGPLRDKARKGDDKNLIKLAAAVEALQPDQADGVVAGNEPSLISEIRERVIEGSYWTTRDPADPSHRTRDRFFPTAFVLNAGHRFQAFRDTAEYSAAAVWLANELITNPQRQTPVNLGFVGLALLPASKGPNASARVIAALDLCEERLTERFGGRTQLVLDRPVFMSFQLGSGTDYMFLHPELLAALFFLRRQNPLPTRRFVLRVVEQLTDNVTRNSGFAGDGGAIPAVDQLWAARLLAEFVVEHETRGTESFLPRWDSLVGLGTTRNRYGALALVIVLVVVFGLVGGASLGAALAIAALLVAGALVQRFVL